MARPKAKTADLSRVAYDHVIGGSTLAGRIVEALEHAILNGDLSPGERVSADNLALHFGVSKVPVREAFKSLEAEGWIRQLPRQGYYVEGKSAEVMADLFETRIVLEPAAAMLAAEHRNDSDLAEMAHIIARSRLEIEANDVSAISRSNQDFHAAIARAARNSVLEPILIKLGKHVRFYTIRVDSRRYTAADEHEMLLEAIRSHDVAEARRIATDHVMATRLALDEQLMAAKTSGAVIKHQIAVIAE